jgi:hypothetical protein
MGHFLLSFCLFVFVLRQGLAIYTRLALNSPPFCLSFQNVKILGMHHHAWLLSWLSSLYFSVLKYVDCYLVAVIKQYKVTLVYWYVSKPLLDHYTLCSMLSFHTNHLMKHARILLEILNQTIICRISLTLIFKNREDVICQTMSL